jgi:hypothetical protein
MSTYSDYYDTGANLAKLEFEKQAFIANLGKLIWNSAPRKALGYLTGMGGRIGSKGSFAYKYLPSHTVGSGLGFGMINAATAEEGNKSNAFLTGALTGVGFGVMGRHAGRLGARIFNPSMQRSNLARYSNMGFKPDAARAMAAKNELAYVENALSNSGGNISKLKNYTSSEQFKLLDANSQKFISEGLSKANKGYVADDFLSGLSKLKQTAKTTADDLYRASDKSAINKYRFNKGLKYTGAVGLGIGGTFMVPLNDISQSVANRVVPPIAQTPSNMYNPYYGGMK